MQEDVDAIHHCIRRCAGASDERVPGQAQRRLAEKLARTGSERIARDVAAAARRVGEFIAQFKA